MIPQRFTAYLSLWKNQAAASGSFPYFRPIREFKSFFGNTFQKG